MGTFLVVPIIRIIIYWGLYWGPLILGNYHHRPFREDVGSVRGMEPLSFGMEKELDHINFDSGLGFRVARPRIYDKNFLVPPTPKNNDALSLSCDSYRGLIVGVGVPNPKP